MGPEGSRMRSDPLQTRLWQENGGQRAYVKCIERGKVGLEDGGHLAHYLRRPFHREPDFGVTSVNYDFGKLLARAEHPL